MMERKVSIIVLTILVLIFIFKIKNKKKRSVLNVSDYEYMKDIVRSKGHVYEDPDNYIIKDDKIVSISPEINEMEYFFNYEFKDKPLWCLTPLYADLPMNGPFPTIKECGLSDFCETLKKNIHIFKTDFNKNTDKFVNNPEKLGYNNNYGRIDINRDGFEETKKILNSNNHYKLTQMFNRYAGYSFMSTTFTILFPGGAIRPHYGPTNFKYRIHLCLDIDGDGGLVTPYGTRRWKTGEIFILDDSYLHSGFYEGTRPRVIIMIDMAKPNLKYEHIDRLIKSVKEDKVLCKKLEDNKLTEEEIKESEK